MDPPHFREGDEASFQACQWCRHFANQEYCKKYERMMLPGELCDSFVSVFLQGRQQVATR